MRRLPILLLALVAIGAPARAQEIETPRGFALDTVARLEFPTGLQLTPSGRDLYVNERLGRIRIVRNGQVLARPFATVETATRGEGGLLGLALHPEFERGEPWVYVFYTRPDGSDRVERFRSNGRRATEREVIVDRLPNPSGRWHHGGALAFGPDGMLYVSHGEGHDRDRAQDPRTLGGKVYRYTPEGEIPDDNPFAGSPTWAYGVRNPFGLAFDPETDFLWESENGPSGHDEVNLIEPGRNYGWPVVVGRAGDERFVDPIVDYERTIVPTMMAFAGEAFPEEYRGNLFLGSCAPGQCGAGALRRLVLTGDRRDVARDEVLLRAEEGIVGLAWGPDGLYFSTPTRVMRLRSAQEPSPTSTPSPTAAPSPTATLPTALPSGSVWPWVGLGIIAVAVALAAGLLARQRREAAARRERGGEP